MTGGPTPRQHALRVAALEALVALATKQLQTARREAEQAFKTVRIDGQSQQRVLLPSGEDIGLISIKAGTSTSDVTDAKLLAWCREHLPGGIEEYIDPAAFASIDLVAVVKVFMPEVIRERVRPDTADELRAEIIASGGYLLDKETCEKTKLAEVTKHDPTGAFAFSGGGSDHRRRRIVEEWQAGRLQEIGFGPRALPPAVPEQPAA